MQSSTYSIRLQRHSAWRSFGPDDNRGGILSGDGKRVLVRLAGGGLSVFDQRTGVELNSLTDPAATVWGASADASIIASINGNGDIAVYAENSEPRALGPRPSCYLADARTWWNW